MPDPDALRQIYNACDPYKAATGQYYLDCGEEDNPFTPTVPWYAFNPIVRELQKFKSARTAQSKLAP